MILSVSLGSEKRISRLPTVIVLNWSNKFTSAFLFFLTHFLSVYILQRFISTFNKVLSFSVIHNESITSPFYLFFLFILDDIWNFVFFYIFVIIIYWIFTENRRLNEYWLFKNFITFILTTLIFIISTKCFFLLNLLINTLLGTRMKFHFELNSNHWFSIIFFCACKMFEISFR